MSNYLITILTKYQHQNLVEPKTFDNGDTHYFPTPGNKMVMLGRTIPRELVSVEIKPDGIVIVRSAREEILDEIIMSTADFGVTDGTMGLDIIAWPDTM